MTPVSPCSWAFTVSPQASLGPRREWLSFSSHPYLPFPSLLVICELDSVDLVTTLWELCVLQSRRSVNLFWKQASLWGTWVKDKHKRGP